MLGKIDKIQYLSSRECKWGTEGKQQNSVECFKETITTDVDEHSIHRLDLGR